MKFLSVLFLFLSVSVWAGAPISSTRTKHSVSNYLTSSWTTLNSGIAKTSNWVHAYNSSLSGTLLIGLGQSGSEVQYLVLQPGSDLVIPFRVAKTTRISIKAADSTVSTGNSVFDWME